MRNTPPLLGADAGLAAGVATTALVGAWTAAAAVGAAVVAAAGLAAAGVGALAAGGWAVDPQAVSSSNPAPETRNRSALRRERPSVADGIASGSFASTC